MNIIIAIATVQVIWYWKRFVVKQPKVCLDTWYFTIRHKLHASIISNWAYIQYSKTWGHLFYVRNKETFYEYYEVIKMDDEI